MTRKKSRPTHRENAAAVPSNDGGFYKMFWNSMDTNPGTNGPNSPSQGDAPQTSPPVIILSDSEDSSSARDENSCENLVVPPPIKEEILEDSVMSLDQHSCAETSTKTVQESHSGINGNSSSRQTCLPGNPLTSPSKISSPSPPHQSDLNSPEKSPQTSENPTLISTCADSPDSGTFLHNPEIPRIPSPSEIRVTSDQPLQTPCRPEEEDNPMKLVEDTQVCDQAMLDEQIEMSTESNMSKVANSNDLSDAIISIDNNVISNEARSAVDNSDNTPVANEEINLAPPISEEISTKVADHNCGIPEEPVTPISELQTMDGISETSNISNKSPISSEIPHEMLEETPMEPESEPQTQAVSEANYEETPLELPGLSLLRSLLNAPDEDLEGMNLDEVLAELPGFNERTEPSDQNSHNEGGMVCYESEQESSLPSTINVSDMDVDQSTTFPDNCHTADENLTPDVSHRKETNEKVVDEVDEFPTYNNFLPKKIKLDTIGILRSVNVLKDSVRSLYKEYLRDDIILRTVGTSEPPVENEESSDEVEEMPRIPLINVYPICCVKMERLPEPFVKVSTVTMSDDTFKTWKRQIIRQRNEEKFRHLKVWRRGRTLLWRECELAGMDRATYDEQVNYVKKHKLNEDNLSDNDSSDDSGDDSTHKCDSSEEAYSDLENEDSEGELSSLPSLTSPTKLSSETPSVVSHVTSETSTGIYLSEDEYIVERNNQCSETKTPSALKITIRKASTSKSDDDKGMPAGEEESFPVPAHPTVKPRKIVTKRTYRRQSDPIPKASVPPKAAAADNKKTKNTSVEDEYDQSLLGTRSYEVENFNLLEKWDIPFEEPTLFRSPRAASRLAQLKTKEAFQPIKRYAPPKNATITATTSSTTVSTTSTRTGDVSAAGATTIVSKAVKDVVEMLCSKTVEAMLFPESNSTDTLKLTGIDVNREDGKDSTMHVQPSKSSLPSEETSSTLDESSEFSQSETNSVLDASSDFGGSTASLVSEDFLPPKKKSPQKPRRRRPRFGPAWGKKKKVKSKVTNEQPVEEGASKKDDHSVEDINVSPIHSTAKPVTGKVVQENDKSIQKVRDSPVHSTQVPVVSEGPGQSPYESEDDSAHRLKEPIGKSDSNSKVNEPIAEILPKDEIRLGEAPSEEPEPTKRVQEDVVPPRLTRSKQPTVQLDPDLLENFGTRKRKPKTDIVNVSQGKDGKKLKLEVTKKPPQKSKAQPIKLSSLVTKDASSMPGEVANDDSNTQVPEVSSSEGPGDILLEQENKLETGEPTVRMLRSHSRGPGPRPVKSVNSSPVKHSTDDDKKTVDPSQPEEGEPDHKNQPDEPLVLESPASPSPETGEPEPFTNGRITRSKRRSGPAYVAVKSTNANPLPSVCDVVDSIAGNRLPTPSKLFDVLTSVTSSSPFDLISESRAQNENIDQTTVIEGKGSSSELGQQPEVAQNESPDDKSVKPPTTIESQKSTLEQSLNPIDSDSSRIETVSKSATSLDIADETIALSNDVKIVDIAQTGLQTEKSQIVEDDLGTIPARKDLSSGTPIANCNLTLDKPVTENVECGRLEVLDTLNSILAVTSPKKTRSQVSTASPLLPPPLSINNLPATPVSTSISQPPLSNILTPTVSSTSLPGFLNSTQDVNNIPCLPGTFLSSFLNTTLDASLNTYNNEINDSTSLADDPDGDLVIDESDVNFDVNFFENLTNADLDKNDNSADFSDDDNNTDLADKIDKIVKDQIYQDPVPVPSLKTKETGSGNEKEKVLEETSPSNSVLNRRDSIDDRTGLPTNFIQRLRDPRIRSRLLSQLEEEEATGKTQNALSPLLNSLSARTVIPSTVGAPQAGKIGDPNPGGKAEVVAVGRSGSTTFSSCGLQVPIVLQVVTQPVTGAPFESTNSTITGQPTPLVLPKTPPLAATLVKPGALAQLPLAAHGKPIPPAEESDKPEEPPDPSKVDFLVPPSDDEEDECIKRRPKKAKKQVDVELMYKSPLEDLQSEARPGYGERAPRRYADSFPRRRSGDDRSRWDDRRSRDDHRFVDRGRSRSRDRRFEDRGRSRSRDLRFEDRARSRSRDGRFDNRGRSCSRDGRFDDHRRERSRSRDRRSFYHHSPRDHSSDRQAYDPYSGREDTEIVPHHVEMQGAYYQSPWSVSPAFHHHQMAMQSPRWQPNCHPEPHVPHPPIFMPEPPKIDFMETRLINLELLPKTTNLEISPIRKVFQYFDKGSVQVMNIPPPTYDPKDQPHPIKMMDPVSEEIVDFIQTPRPTGGLTKAIFKSFPPDLNLEDVVKFHFISPSYIMVRDNEQDSSSSSDEEEDELETKQNLQDRPLQHKRMSQLLLEYQQKLQHKTVDENLQKLGGKPSLEHHIKVENELITENHLKEKVSKTRIREDEDTPLQNLLHNLPLLKQFNLQQCQPPIPPPPPPPEWNDVDLRISRELAMETKSSPARRNPSPPLERPRNRSRSGSKSPRSTSSSPPKSPRSTSHGSRSNSRRSRSNSPRSSSRRSRSNSPRSSSRRSRSNSPRSSSRRSRSNSPRSSSRRSRSNSPRSSSRRSLAKTSRLKSHRSRKSLGSKRRRSRSRSLSLSDNSISTLRSRSRSPSYSRRRSPRRRRSRSRSSEWSRSSHSRRSLSPKRHSTSISPSRKHRR